MNNTSHSNQQHGFAAVDIEKNTDSKNVQRGFAALDPEKRKQIAAKGGSIARRSRVKELQTVSVL